MARFLSDLIAKKRSDGDWELVEDLEYHVGSANSNEVIIVPKGFVSDLASTPIGVRNIFPKDGPWTHAAIIHDYCYFTGHYSRKVADEIFLEAMKVGGVSLWKRRIMYRALRMFGFIAWNQHRKRDRKK